MKQIPSFCCCQRSDDWFFQGNFTLNHEKSTIKWWKKIRLLKNSNHAVSAITSQIVASLIFQYAPMNHWYIPFHLRFFIKTPRIGFIHNTRSGAAKKYQLTTANHKFSMVNKKRNKQQTEQELLVLHQSDGFIWINTGHKNWNGAISN